VRREGVALYTDQYEYLADCFDLIRLRSDAYTLRSEAMETERLARYIEPHGRDSDRSHILEIYYELERSIAHKEEAIQRRKRDSERAGVRFPIDVFAQNNSLDRDEVQILLVLLFNEAAGKNQTRVSTGNDILNLLHPNPVDALKASRYLASGASLLRHGLVRCLTDEETTNFLRSSYEVTEKTLREILGARGRASVSDYRASQEAVADGPYRVVEPRFTLDRVVLNGRARATIEDILWQVRDGSLLFEQWEMGRLLEKGRGVVALFSGVPGTGKTMTAEAMAGTLRKKLIFADYSQLESKWIGETEKNIVAVFRAAVEADAVLLLDEADAVLAGRLDGGHYNDRAYNRQVSLLLQELENFEGLCILTTNREPSLDEGLARRIGSRIHFEVPGHVERETIWRSLISPRVPLAADVDFTALAARFPIAGGHIKNAVLAALRAGARREGLRSRICQGDFIKAAEQEKSSFQVPSRSIGFGPRLTYS
jgi:AAA+ superfamily predicted ATPase